MTDESKYVLKEDFSLLFVEFIRLREFVLNDGKTNIELMDAFRDGFDNLHERIAVLEDAK